MGLRSRLTEGGATLTASSNIPDQFVNVILGFFSRSAY